MEHTFESIQSRIIAIVAQTLKVKPADFNVDTSLVEELGADSLDALSIALDVDEEFGIQVDDAELRKFNTCNDIVAAVVRHLKIVSFPVL
ncbi:MAG TPA: acyl carrier protein [Candidatus Angelobacter sp.]|jgi:acyl carrier protein